MPNLPGRALGPVGTYPLAHHTTPVQSVERDSREIKTSASLWQRGGPPTDRRPPVGLARRGALTAPYATNSNGQGAQVMNCVCVCPVEAACPRGLTDQTTRKLRARENYIMLRPARTRSLIPISHVVDQQHQEETESVKLN